MNAVVMGRKTWESIPIQNRPLKDRINVILTSNQSYEPEIGAASPSEGDIVIESDFHQALKNLGARSDIRETFIIGGSEIYK
jgi:dihydrofolate reductase